MNALEEALGIRLLNRTTRSVSPTEAGQRLLERLAPALSDIRLAIAEVDELRDSPSGTLRVNAPGPAVDHLLCPLAFAFMDAYPDVKIEIISDAAVIDIVEQGFDAGVRFGKQLAQDMIAVRIGPDLRMAVAASPAYLETCGTPNAPDDLSRYNCINLKHQAKGGNSVWDLEKDGRVVNVRVEGQIIVNDIAIVRQAAVDGLGLCYLPRDYLEAEIETGDLIPVMEDWCPPFPGYHLYYPSRRQQSPALAAFVAAVRYKS